MPVYVFSLALLLSLCLDLLSIFVSSFVRALSSISTSVQFQLFQKCVGLCCHGVLFSSAQEN